jgi:hypothetical protein
MAILALLYERPESIRRSDYPKVDLQSGRGVWNNLIDGELVPLFSAVLSGHPKL